MEIIANSDDYRITFHAAGDKPSDTLIITFSGLPTGLEDQGFGTDFCLVHGYDTIFTAQRIGTQYQGLSLEDFHAAVAPKVAEYKNVVCYGPSLGGYASLYYGGSINARIIVAGPLLPAWPHLKNRKCVDLVITHKPLAEVPKTEHSPVVVFDPMFVGDKRNIEMMVAPVYPNMRKVEVPFSGHPVLVSLAKARILRPFILHFFETGEVMDFERPAEGTAIWHRERARYFLKNEPEKAKEEFEKSLAIEDSKLTFNLLLQCLIRLGELEDAQAQLDMARTSENKTHQINVHIAKFATDSGLHV